MKTRRSQLPGAAAAVAAVAALAATPRTVRADGGIVIESYTGGRPGNADELLAPVLAELATRGWSVGYDGVGRRFEAAVSRPARSVHGVRTDFLQEVERGHRAWIRGRFDDAVATLAPLVDAAAANPAAVSQDQQLREGVRRGLLDLALAHQRLGDTGSARDAMAELIRSFPDVVVSRAAHGPEALELYETARKGLATGDRGTLVVDVSDPNTALFVNERFERVGSLRKRDLVAGRYRVYGVVGKREGRTYDVEVKPGAEASIAIDWMFDQTIHVVPTWTGFAFAAAGERERNEAAYAARLANLVQASAVAVVGVDAVRGRPALVGSLVSLDSGRELRRASVALDPPPSAERLRALARFLAGDAASNDLDVALGPPVEAGPRVRAPPGPEQRWGKWKYATIGAGVIAAGVGGYLIAIDGQCDGAAPAPPTPCPQVKSTAVPGYLAAGAGAALIGLGIYMIVTERTVAPDRPPPLAVIPHDGGLVGVVSWAY